MKYTNNEMEFYSRVINELVAKGLISQEESNIALDYIINRKVKNKPLAA